MDTRVFVVVVPMLAPMMTGTASSMERAPEATSPTTMVVVVDELWMMAVATNPRRRPSHGIRHHGNETLGETPSRHLEGQAQDLDAGEEEIEEKQEVDVPEAPRAARRVSAVPESYRRSSPRRLSLIPSASWSR
jgi:hypothetical protein